MGYLSDHYSNEGFKFVAVMFPLLFTLSLVLVSVKSIQEGTCNLPHRHRKGHEHQINRMPDTCWLRLNAFSVPSFQFKCVLGPSPKNINYAFNPISNMYRTQGYTEWGALL